MQKIMGYMRRCITDYRMLEPGDGVAVGLSGGKDSVALLTGLARLREYIGIPFSLHAITLDPCFGGEETDYSPIEELCRGLDVPFELRRTNIGRVIFELREEPNPCALCAKMRRGALHAAAKELGCNKIALGHHMDDAVETFVMNLTIEGRIGCFSPVSYLSRRELTLIRPLVYAPEREIAKAVRRAELPVVKSRCPADGATRRQQIKDELWEREKQDPGLKTRLFGALRRSHIDGW